MLSTRPAFLSSWHDLCSGGEHWFPTLKMRRLRFRLHNWWVVEPRPKTKCCDPVPFTTLFNALIHVCSNHKTLKYKAILRSSLDYISKVRPCWSSVETWFWKWRSCKSTQRCWKTDSNNFLRPSPWILWANQYPGKLSHWQPLHSFQYEKSSL